MKHILLIISLVFIFSLHLRGQNYSTEFGKIGQAEADLKQYSHDKTAEAVVLFDIGKSYFLRNNNSFEVGFDRETRIKILTDAGVKWAEIEIPFYHEGGVYEGIHNIEAYTYNYENGKMIKTKLDVTQTYDEKLNNNWSVRKFALPGVKKGSIIEYRYQIISQYMFNLRDWKFQWRIPVIYSEYEVDMIPFYEYTFLLQGAKKFDDQESHRNIMPRQFGPVAFQDMVYKYVMKDVPAFKSEEYITSINDYIIKMDFQLSKINHIDGSVVNIMTTWEDMITRYIKNPDFGKYVKKSEKISSKLLDENLEDKSDDEKFNYILNFVKSNFNWNKVNDKFVSKTPSKFVADKYGNCADINLFTVGMLNNAGIEAYPVLISTRDHGKIKYNYPYSHFFNYVIILAKINGENILSDATGTYLLNKRLPPRCINDKGLVIDDKEVNWVSLECRYPSEIETKFEINFSDNFIHAEITKSLSEYDALEYRINYADDKELIKEKLISEKYHVSDSSISIENQDNKYKPYILRYTMMTEPEVIRDKIYIAPFFDETLTDNPLKQKDRTYPLDMIYPKKRKFISTIIIPDEYQIDFLPEKLEINNQMFSLNYKIIKNDSVVKVMFDYFFKKSVYPPEAYSKIKFYFKEIVKKGNEKVVFSRKTE
jgi:hypothetical protein